MFLTSINVLLYMNLINNNKCFVCGKDNPFGLRLDFMLDGKKLKSEVILDDKFQGFQGIIHGGIIAALLDEMMGNLAFKLGINAVTANININLRKPAQPNEKYFLLGEIVSEEGKKVHAKSELKDSEGNIVADASGLLIRIK